MSRKPTCECGTCEKCEARAYGKAWRVAHPNYMRGYYRKRHPNGRPQPRAWTPDEDSLLGTDRDTVVAEVLDRTDKSVEKRRRRLGIGPFRARKPTVNRNGYVVIYLHFDHPLHDMTRSGGYVMEHRYVMADHLGRPLTTDERVHHRNGVRTDNRLENLELWTRSHPDGQRVEDVLRWAQEFIERYELDSVFNVK